MGPTWVLSAPDGPHVGPMNLAIRVGFRVHSRLQSCGWIFRSYPSSHRPQRGSTGAPDTQYVQCLIGHGFTERKIYQSSTWHYQHIWWQDIWQTCLGGIRMGGITSTKIRVPFKYNRYIFQVYMDLTINIAQSHALLLKWGHHNGAEFPVKMEQHPLEKCFETEVFSVASSIDCPKQKFETSQ